MYYDFLQTHKQKIIKSAIAIFVLIILWTAAILIGRIGKLPVTVSVVPSDAKVLIDGNGSSNGTQWITPGKHTVSVEKSGFDSQKVTITVSADKSQNVAALSLIAKSDDAKKWADEHAKEYKDNEKYGAIQARTDGELFTAQNPITKQLPYTDPYYTIGYRLDDNQAVIITVVTESPRYRFYAVEKIRDFGYDPTDFVIEFKDFKNPLEAK